MKVLFILILILTSISLNAAENYQKPTKDILDLVDVKVAPRALIDNKKENIVLISRDTFKSISELSKKELRLAGLRIDPKTNINSRTRYYNEIKIQRVGSQDQLSVSGMPKQPKLANFRWSPDQKYMAFTHTEDNGVGIWILNIAKAKAKKLTKPEVNANTGDVINWFADSKSMLVKMLPKDRKELIDTASTVPTGPTISVSDGKKAQNRTYQDLLKNKTDEFNFEQLARSELVKVSVKGKEKSWLDTGMYSNVSVAPAGNYVLVTELSKPFSYLVTYSRFPHKTSVYNKKADFVKTIVDVPLIEDLPKGFMAKRTGPRSVRWRNDKPASITYFEALDGGDPANKVEYRDQLMQLEAPFNSKAKLLFKSYNRLSAVFWGNNETAIAIDYWWNNRNSKTYLFNPQDYTDKNTVLFDLNYQDRYADPGDWVTDKNQYGKSVLSLDGDELYLLGDGYTKEGQFPFLDKFNLITKKSQRIYRSELKGSVENLLDYDKSSGRLLVRIESKSDYPNYYFRNMDSDTTSQLTFFDNPFKSIQDVTKEVITYKRDDGLELNGTLYLPLNYEEGKKYPMILWAYPREYKDKSSAGQNTSNPNKFTYPSYGSPLYWLTKGYVVLNNAAFPIVGEGDEQPNDSFRTQLVANAKSAIDALDARGLIDRKRVAVGGHSYGAFMVANLLSHSDLFAAGIARSGAYNRTLTPFGFQSEERSYWEAPEVYYTMSPFMHADKMKTPLLLIHGEADNNSGTYPMQSERYFNALKGLGATARLVMLPKESHGYRAKESILHMLWEQDQWLEKYLKSN